MCLKEKSSKIIKFSSLLFFSLVKVTISSAIVLTQVNQICHLKFLKKSCLQAREALQLKPGG